MSINGLLNNALSALQANQVNIRTTSTNIANVNTPGYTRRESIQQSLAVGGLTAGVEIAEIRRVASKFYARELLTVTADSSTNEAMAKIHDRLQSIFGRPEDNNSIVSRLAESFSSLGDASLDPSDIIRRMSAASNLDQMATSLSTLSDQIIDIRRDVETDIADTVDAVNRLLRRVAELNPQIERQIVRGGDASGLEDQRDQALRELSELIDLQTTYQPTGAIWLSTGDGLSLLSTQLVELQYQPPGQSTTATVYQPITANRVDPITGEAMATGIDFNEHVAGGRLRGLLTMRDQTLPDVALAVGELAAQVADQFNAVHNDSTPVPAPNSLTGRETGLLGSDAHGFSGQTSFAVVDQSGAISTWVTVDFDANTYSVDGAGATAFGGTINDLVSAVNTGLGGAGTLSFSGGVMSFQAASGTDGVAIKQDGTTPSSRAGRGFAHFFGMNDLFRAAAPSHYDTGFAGTDAHGFGAGETADFELRGPDGQVLTSFQVTMTGGGTFNDILADLNAGAGVFGSFSLDANGALSFTPSAGYESYKVNVTDDLTDRGGTGVSLSGLFGIGDRFKMDHAQGFALRSDIAGDPTQLGFAQLELTGATAPGDTVLSVGDNRGALAMQDLASKSVSFDTAGPLSAASSSLTDYSARILSWASNEAADVDGAFANAQALQSELDQRRLEIEGVNLDEELANLVIYQQSYNAAARMITAAEELFDTLLRAV